jgi:phosphatidate cytidylyltransferase
LKKRIISAFLALLICIPITYIGGLPFKILAIVISFLGFIEINKLLTENNVLKATSLFCFLIIILSNINKNNLNNILDYKLIGIIFLLFFMVEFLYRKDFDLIKCFSLIFITIFLSFSFSIMIIIRNINLYYFLYFLVITISTDTFAYIFGSLFGKHKINEISIKKTIEGAISGSFFGTLISVLYYLSFINNNINIFIIVVITLFLTIIGQLGDLFFSLIKRYFKIKDFSNILPGHGGVLDRFDSFIFVMLAITYFINFI